MVRGWNDGRYFSPASRPRPPQEVCVTCMSAVQTDQEPTETDLLPRNAPLPCRQTSARASKSSPLRPAAAAREKTSWPFMAEGGSPFHSSSDPEIDLSSSSPLRNGFVTKLTSEENDDPCMLAFADGRKRVFATHETAGGVRSPESLLLARVGARRKALSAQILA